MSDNYEAKASSEWVSKLQDAITEIKISSANIDQKLDQMKEDFAKVETSIAKLSDTTSKQELNEDMALIKATLSNYQKFLWILSSGVVGLLLKTLFDISV